MLRRPWVLALSFFLLSCSSKSTTPQIDFSTFDAKIEQFLTDNSLAGATAVVVHREYGVVHTKAYGSFTTDRISLLASSSKVLSVGVIMRLVDRGLIDLDAPVSQYMSVYGSYKTDITVAELLSNSSGLVGLADDPLYPPYLCQYLPIGTLDSCAGTIYTADDQADRVPPDTAFHYGGGQWQLAGGIAEAASGKTWAELIDETYVRPCGVHSLGYSNHYSQSFASGGVSGALSYPSFFQGDVSTLPETDNPSIEGGAYSTVTDYGTLLLMHLRGGVCGKTRVLSAASVARMQEDRIGMVYGGSTGLDPTLQGYGLGWWVSRDEPGFVSDPGAFGAVPWLDDARGYGVMIILEADAKLGVDLRVAVKPVVDAIFDALPM